MRHKDLTVAAAMLAAGIVFMVMSAGVPNRDGVDASTVPTLLAGMMIALGLIELATSWRRHRAALPEGTAETGVEAPSPRILAADAAVQEGAAEAAETERDAQHRDAGGPGTAQPAGQGFGTVGLTLALIAAYVALLTPLGFPIATAAYLFVQFVVLTPRVVRAPLGLYAAIAVVAAVAIFAIFRYGFDLLLPAGPLTTLLP